MTKNGLITSVIVLMGVFLLRGIEAQSIHSSYLSTTLSGNLGCVVIENDVAYGLMFSSGSIEMIVAFNIATTTPAIIFRLPSPSFLLASPDILFSKLIVTSNYIIGGSQFLDFWHKGNNSYITTFNTTKLEYLVYIQSSNKLFWKDTLGQICQIELNDMNSLAAVVVRQSGGYDGLVEVDGKEQFWIVWNSLTRQVEVYHVSNNSLASTIPLNFTPSASKFILRSAVLVIAEQVNTPTLHFYNCLTDFSFMTTQIVPISSSQSPIDSIAYNEHQQYLTAKNSHGEILKLNLTLLQSNYQLHTSNTLEIKYHQQSKYFTIISRNYTYLQIYRSIGFDSSCLQGYYYDSGSTTCIECMDYCLKCSSGSVCEDCIFGLGLCCGVAKYADLVLNSCVACGLGCQQCTNATHCEVCGDGLVERDGNCCREDEDYDHATNSCKPRPSLLCDSITVVNSRQICISLSNSSMLERVIIQTASVLLKTPMLRLLLKFLSIFFQFIDEYFYYYFHDRTYNKMRISSTFFVIIYQINQERLIPFEFIKEWNNDTKLLKGGNYSGYGSENEYIESDISFMCNVKDLLLCNFPAVCFFIGFLRMLSKLLKCILKKVDKADSQSCGRRVKNYLYKNSSVWALMVALIEPNLIVICFEGVRQVKLSFGFGFVDKANLLLCLLLLFVAFFYAFAFYPVAFYSNPIIAQQLMELDRSSKFSFYNEFVRQTFKIFLMGLVHGAFLDNYLIQISLILAIRLLNFGMILKSSTTLKSMILYCLFILKSLLGILFDLLLLCSYYVYELNGTFDIANYIVEYHNILEVILIFGMIMLGGIIVLTKMIILGKDILCGEDPEDDQEACKTLKRKRNKTRRNGKAQQEEKKYKIVMIKPEEEAQQLKSQKKISEAEMKQKFGSPVSPPPPPLSPRKKHMVLKCCKKNNMNLVIQQGSSNNSFMNDSIEMDQQYNGSQTPKKTKEKGGKFLDIMNEV